MNDRRPLFTIVTITYNAQECLEPTMRSVAEQTCTDFEHLIIDGASKDRTLEIASRLRSPQCRIVSEPDRGLYDAMNKGLDAARGEFVIFLNAGDAFHSPQTLAHYAAKANTGNYDIIYGDTLIVNSKREVIGPRHLSALEVLTFKSFSQGMLVCHQAFCMRLELAPHYDMGYRFSADYDWCVRCLKRVSPERCANLHEVTIDYLSDGMTDKNKRASLMERMRIMCHHYGTLPTLGRHVGFALRALRRKL